MSTTLEKAAAQTKEWRRNPVKFVFDNFGVDPDPWQRKVLNDFADPEQRRVAMQSCAGPGKSAVEAWCGWNFLACYGDKGEHPNGVAVSVTADNLKDNLWKELAKWHDRSEYLKHFFTWTKERIFAKQHASTWFMSARSWSKTADGESQGRTLSGLHASYVLYLVDESGEINPSVARSAEQGLSNCRWGKIVQAGNPTSHDGMLYQAATKQREKWALTRVTGDPDDPERSTRIDLQWAKDQIAEYGRDNPWVMAYILGLFPPSSMNALLGPNDMEAAMNRHLKEDDYAFSQKRMGIDAARFGDDPWVIFPRQGLAAFMPVEMRHPRSEEVAARVALGKNRWGCEAEFFDGTGGFAAGAIDAYRLAGFNPYEVNFSGKADDPRYFNKRSEMLFRVAEWVKRGGSLPNLPVLVKEFTTPKFWFEKGKFRVEEKEQIYKRLRHSTNFFDGLGLTMATADSPGGKVPEWIQRAQPRVESDFDPLDSRRIEEALA